MSTPLEKAVDEAQAALTGKARHSYDTDSWDIFVGNQMQKVLDAARVVDVEALAEAWANVMDGRRIGSGLNTARIGRDTVRGDDWQAILTEYRAILAERQP